MKLSLTILIVDDNPSDCLFLKEMLNQQQELSNLVYKKTTHSNGLNSSLLKIFSHKKQVFSGNVMLAAYKPSGGMHILLGDFTGHGLSVVIGTLSLVEIFLDQTKKGVVMRQILPELNVQLNSVLPAGMYCGAVFIDVNPSNSSIEVWNGGFSDLLFFSSSPTQPNRLISKNLPLGALSSAKFEEVIDTVYFQSGDTLLAYSDSEVDVSDRFDWLARCLQKETILDSSSSSRFCFEVYLDDQMSGQSGDVLITSDVARFSTDLSFEYTLNADTLKSTDPLPYILQIITTVSGLEQYASHVFMILSELYSNALEHGVLKLSSDKKEAIEGFTGYYKEREQALAELRDGFVKIQIKVASNKNLGELVLCVTDSGSGFDYQNVKLDASNANVSYNRGLALLTQLCETLEFSNGGRTVTAHFNWSIGEN